ncbi:unnamed protein product [Adineta steineri]|uniref:Cation efflux protein cytoplasmic domain-containing protein n=1 Tax=Adineta steineri TaxID=433720 RepID=A0A813NPZ9_9BILA|nr:unnamed protein product [Adineta steineri]CAF0752550.1 unnamed protein product [Adineta steineri]CAF0868463.1 unnamed protein product [Adineta steineri]
MSDSKNDEVRVLPEETQKLSSFNNNLPNPSRPIRFLLSRRQASRTKSTVGLIHEVDTVEEPETTKLALPKTYGYLEHIQSFKPLCTPDDKKLPRKVRKFYKDQVKLITSIEDVLAPKSDEEEGKGTDSPNHQSRSVRILTMVLFILKIIAFIVSRSLSVLSSVVDSAVDLLTSLILIWTHRKMKKRDYYKYPGGRTRLEPVAIVILSVIMCAASVEVIFESGQTLNQDIEYFTHKNSSSKSTYTLPRIDMTLLPIVSMAITIVTKAILFIFCIRVKNPSIYALAEDHRNDVASNIVALACGLVAYNALQGKIKQELIVVDPIGGIVISVYIIIAWILQASTQIRNLTGICAETKVLQRLTHIIYNYRSDVVTKIDSVQVAHYGTNYFVEVDVGLPGAMPLADAHDIAVDLQNQLESIDDIERAYVHLDFEFSRIPTAEHKDV